MKKQLTVLLFFISLVVVSQSGITISDSIVSGSIYRKFRLYIPTSYTNPSVPVPLLFNLHGYGSNATQQQVYGNFMPVADTARFLIVHPEGTAPLGSQYFNAGFGPGVNDVLFMSDLIDSLKLSYNIDEDRVYSCGMSNGGIMSYYLACLSPNRFAAIASVTGSMLNAWFNLSPNRPFPVMQIHGTNDATVPYAGNANFVHVDSMVKKWVQHNQCNTSPITYSVPDIVPGDGATALHYRYTGGQNGAEVEFYKVINGAHTWPGASIPIGITCMDFNASYEIWRFFSKYKKTQLITNTNDDILNKYQKIVLYPNPARQEVWLKHELENSPTIELINQMGQLVKCDITYYKETVSINMQNLSTGVYFIKIFDENRELTFRKIVKQ